MPDITQFTVGAPVALQSLYVGAPVETSGPGQEAHGFQYTHTQATPATVWTVQHNLNRRPTAVAVFSLDYATQWDEYSIFHVDDNRLYITADLAFPGIALIG